MHLHVKLHSIQRFALNSQNPTFRDFYLNQIQGNMPQTHLILHPEIMASKFDKHFHHTKIICIRFQSGLVIIFSHAAFRMCVVARKNPFKKAFLFEFRISVVHLD